MPSGRSKTTTTTTTMSTETIKQKLPIKFGADNKKALHKSQFECSSNVRLPFISAIGLNQSIFIGE